MKNPVICSNCSTENPFYSYVCSGCKHFLRDKIVNIDLWETIIQLLESPCKAFQKIILAENKNFIVFLTLFYVLRLFIVSRFLSLPFFSETESTTSLLTGYIIVLFTTTCFLLLFAWITALLLNKFEYSIRFRDNYSLLVYSNIPNIISLVLLFPIELIIFGEYLFSNNPNPFQVKPFFAYVLLIFEIGVFIWSLILIQVSFRTLTGSRIIGLLILVIYSICLIGLLIILANILFFL